MSDKMSVGFIFGSASSEYEISCISCASVLDNVDTTKYTVVKIGISRANSWYIYTGENRNISDASWEKDTDRLTAVSLSLDSSRKGLMKADGGFVPLDCVMPVMHGRFGEDGKLQGLFNLVGIPCCGCGALSSAISMDKAITKTLCGSQGIPVGGYVSFFMAEYHENPQKIAESLRNLALPLFVKPANAGSSVGITKVRTPDELDAAVRAAALHDRKIIVEGCNKGSEIEVSALGNSHSSQSPIISICGEINPNADFYDYDTKYLNDTAEYFIPARISEETSNKVRAMAQKVYEILECAGFARIDFFVDEPSGQIIFNEINTIPGFTAISMYAKLMGRMGYTFTTLIDRIIELALSGE